MDYFYFSASRRKRGSSPGPLDHSQALKVQCLRVPNALLDNLFFYFEERSKYSHNLTTRQCSPVRRKFMECYIINPAQSLLIKHLVIGQRFKAPDFSAFHWSPRGNLVSIGQLFVIKRVEHLPKRTETSLITESDRFGPIR